MISATPSLGSVAPTYLELTCGRTLRIWWALCWRALLLGAGSGFTIGFLEGFLGVLTGWHWLRQPATTLLSGLIVGLPAGVYAVYLALTKQYKYFSIRLVPF